MISITSAVSACRIRAGNDVFGLGCCRGYKGPARTIDHAVVDVQLESDSIKVMAALFVVCLQR